MRRGRWFSIDRLSRVSICASALRRRETLSEPEFPWAKGRTFPEKACPILLLVSGNPGRGTRRGLLYAGPHVRLSRRAIPKTQKAEEISVAVEFTRWFLALFFLCVAAFYTARIFVLKQQLGASPVYFGRFGTLHWGTHATFRVFRVLILGVCLVRLAWPDFDKYLVTFDALWHPVVLILGSGLLLAGFSAVVVVHFYMGEGWRSGTRKEDRTRLITGGPFAYSRNPMMLSVILAQVGLFLALPSLFTLVCLVFGVWAVTAQVGVEEGLLQHRFGEDYDAYLATTPRWLIFR